jgi:hypothetical protein
MLDPYGLSSGTLSRWRGSRTSTRTRSAKPSRNLESACAARRKSLRRGHRTLGHEDVMTTLRSYGEVPSPRQAEIIRNLHQYGRRSRTQDFRDDRPADNERVCCCAEFGRPQIRLISSARCRRAVAPQGPGAGGDRGLIRLAKKAKHGSSWAPMPRRAGRGRRPDSGRHPPKLNLPWPRGSGQFLEAITRRSRSLLHIRPYSSQLARSNTGIRMKVLTAKDAKCGFGRLIDLARAEPVAIAKHGRSVVVVKALDAPAAVRTPRRKAKQ